MSAWDDLRYFLAVARSGSLTGAARTLRVNHSTVFRRINQFETRLGVRLFERLREGYLLTGVGERVAREAERMEEAVSSVERLAAGRDRQLEGPIRMTVAANLATDYVAEYLPAFHQRHPKIEIEIAVSDSDFDLSRREADLALRATKVPPSSLVGRKVVDLPWWACAGESYIERFGRPASVEDLDRHSLIGADDQAARLAIFSWQKASFQAERIVARSNDLNTMAALCIAGLGIAFLPVDQAKPSLRRLFPLQAEFTGQLWLLTHPDLRHVERIRVFSQFLADAFRADSRLRIPSVTPA